MFLSVVVMWQCLECVLKCDKTAVLSNVWWLCGLDKDARARCSKKESSIHIKNGGGGDGTTRRRMMRRRRKGGNPSSIHINHIYQEWRIWDYEEENDEEEEESGKPKLHTYQEWRRRSGCGPTRNR